MSDARQAERGRSAVDRAGSVRVTAARLGAALGACGAPAVAHGAVWAGIGDARAWVGLVAMAVGALLGALTWPVFQPPGETGAGTERPGIGFSALFAGCVSLVAGAFAAFPMGAVIGTAGGLVGGATVALAWRLTQGLGPTVRPLVAFVAGGVAAWVVARMVTM